MTSANPPYPYYYEIPFNPSFFTSDTGTGLSEEQANAKYLQKTTPDTATALETFSAGIKAQKVDGLLSSSIMYVGNNITSGSLILGNTGIRTKNQGIFETASIRTPATNGQLTICTDLVTGGSVDIGSVNGTVNLVGSAVGGVNVPTSSGVTTNAVNVSYLNTALVNVATLNQVQIFTGTNTFNNNSVTFNRPLTIGYTVPTLTNQLGYFNQPTLTWSQIQFSTLATSPVLPIGLYLIVVSIETTGTFIPNFVYFESPASGGAAPIRSNGIPFIASSDRNICNGSCMLNITTAGKFILLTHQNNGQILIAGNSSVSISRLS